MTSESVFLCIIIWQNYLCLKDCALEDSDLTNIYGITIGNLENAKQNFLKITEMCEKSTVEYMEDYLAIKANKGNENYYAVSSQYVLTKEVFDELESNIKNNKLERGEFQLTSALDQVREKYGLMGYVVDGTSYDVGLPEQYIKTVNSFYQI